MTKKEYIERYGEEAYKRYLEQQKQYYKQHREERKQYYQQHREEIRDDQKQYDQQHREERKQYYQQYYQQHRKQHREQHREEYNEYLKQYMRKYNRMFAYCIPEEIQQIENYELAKADNFIGWHIHHRLECVETGAVVNSSRQDLIDWGIYYNRPANELIFLTKSEHRKLHNRAKKYLISRKIY